MVGRCEIDNSGQILPLTFLPTLLTSRAAALTVGRVMKPSTVPTHQEGHQHHDAGPRI